MFGKQLSQPPEAKLILSMKAKKNVAGRRVGDNGNNLDRSVGCR